MIKCVIVKKDVIVEWIDGNLGVKIIMKYLLVYFDGEGVCGMMLFIVFVNKG